VLAQRRTRSRETLIKRLVSYLGYWVINKIAEVSIPPNTGDFRLLSRRVVEELVRLKECHGFLRGMVAVVGFKQTSILFDRLPRFAGAGNYNRFLGSLRIGMNGIICFSTYLLTLTTQIGFIIAAMSFLLALIYGTMKLFDFPFPMGNPTIVILILFMGGIQLICTGILGEYIARIYDEVRQRPRFIVDRAEGFANETPAASPRAATSSAEPGGLTGTLPAARPLERPDAPPVIGQWIIPSRTPTHSTERCTRQSVPSLRILLPEPGCDASGERPDSRSCSFTA
jgi:dolichol-phosphate mannosyltransferase